MQTERGKYPPMDVLKKQTQLILKNYEHWFGKPLICVSGTPEQVAVEVFDAPLVLLSSNADDDPLLNYGNRRGLELWEMDWRTLTQTPGRHTAEPVEREVREQFLAAVRRQGYVTDYRGVRISGTGKRFEIKQASVWNLLGPQGQYCGQAACFTEWSPVSE